MMGEAPGDFRIGDGKGGDGTEEAILFIIRKERDCEAFYSWVAGFSPREHYEMKTNEQRRKSDRMWRVVELAVALCTGALIAIAAKAADHLLSSGNGSPPTP